MEPHETLIRRGKQRRQIKAVLDAELAQLARTATYGQRVSGLASLTALLIDSADEEAKRLEVVRARLLKSCEVISLETAVLAAAIHQQAKHRLFPQDAVVYASVLSHLARSTSSSHCFLNRNTKDFDDPDIVEELKRFNCSLIPSFDDGLAYVRSYVAEAARLP